MTRKLPCVIALLAAALAVSGFKSHDLVLVFKSMYPVSGPFITPQGAVDPNIRGIPGDSMEWTINKSIKGQLFTNGRLVIKVKGLVPDGNIQISLSEFYAAVSCLTLVENPPNPTTIEPVNVLTSGFSTDPDGDAKIHAKLQLPNPCVAPVVMILSGDPESGGTWLAATGF